MLVIFFNYVLVRKNILHSRYGCPNLTLLIFVECSKKSIPDLAPLEAVLFDVDGTLCDSDPLHHYAFREMFQEVFFFNFFTFSNSQIKNLF